MVHNPSEPDLLRGVSAIAEHLGLGYRQAYHLHETGGLPTFKLGASVCARRSALNAWFAEKEAQSRAPQRQGGGNGAS